MKFSNLSLGLAVAASSLVGISAIASDAKAASIYSDNTSSLNGIEFSGLWEFSFVGSYGNYQSNFGVREDGVSTTLFSEVDGSNPGSINGPSTASYTFDFGTLTSNLQTASFFLKTVSPNLPTIYSGLNSGFYIATTNAAVGGLTSTDPAPNNVAFQTAINTYVPQGYRVIGVNDTFKGDRDYNDFIVKARPVPVPAIVPGIALAAAFFGSKALKRNKKVANESVA